MQPETAPDLRPIRQIASAMGVQPAQVRRWVEDGCPVAVKGGPGKSALLDLAAVRAWRAERQPMGGESVARETARLKRAQTRKTELDVRQREGELLERRDVERTWASFLGDASKLIDALPVAAAERVHHAAITDGLDGVRLALTDAMRGIKRALAGGTE